MAVAGRSPRLDCLDGLRGVAAVVVVVHHLVLCLASGWQHLPIKSLGNVVQYPQAVLWNGPFAVSIFFVLSGFVVTEAALRRHDPFWIRIVVRYLRLAVPAAASTLFACLLLHSLPEAARQLQAINGSFWLSFVYQGSVPGLAAALFDGGLRVFVSGGSFFNNVLWTMRPELVGSVLCFVTCLGPGPRFRLAVAAATAVACILSSHDGYAAFPLGIALREAWAAGRLPSAMPLATLLAGLVLGSQAGVPTPTDPERLVNVIAFHAANLLGSVAAMLVIIGVLNSPLLGRMLSSRVGRWLGAISFPLYLVHVPIIYTLVASVAVSAPGAASFGFGLAVICGATLALAQASERWLERPFLQRLRQFRDHWSAREPRVSAA